ncbi:MAG: sulfur carrier protein ThiS [Nitrospirota bacterium]|jgi:thiamine biosynthesis protein ThiS
MQMIINGKNKTISNNTTLAALLNELNIDAQRVAVELNMNIVENGEYAQRVLKDGDTLEIISFVGGGTNG